MSAGGQGGPIEDRLAAGKAAKPAGSKNPVRALLERIGSEAGVWRAAAIRRTGQSCEAQCGGEGLRPHETDQLAAAIADMAGYYRRPVSIAALTSGIALCKGRLPIEHVEIAAQRAGLACEHGEKNLLQVASNELPLVCLMKDGGVEILWSAVHDQNGELTSVRLSVPGRADVPIDVPATEFAQAATGKIIRLKPQTPLDERVEHSVHEQERNWFFGAFRDTTHIYAEAITATVAINLLALAMPLFSMNVYDRVLPNAAEETLWALSSGVMLAVGFDFLIRTLRAHFIDAASRRADVRLSALIYSRLIGARAAGRSASAGVRANTLREFETLRDFFNSATLTAFGDLPFVFMFIAIIGIVAGPLALVVLAAIPLIVVVGWLTQRKLRRLTAASLKEAAQKNAIAVETIVGMDAIKAAGAESWAAQKWEASVAEHIRTGLKIRQTSNAGQHTINTMQTLVQVIVVVAGFYMVAGGQITMGALIASTILCGRALAPLAQAAMLLARFNQAHLAYQMLNEIVVAPQERGVGRRYLNKTTFAGEVAFEKVTFTYEEGMAPALSEFDAVIKPGEHVAMLGGIGSGKTTALKLIQGHLLPQQGRLLVDGVAVTHIEPAQLRRNVGLHLQAGTLFHGTIRENITLGFPLATDEEVISAARSAAALAWIARLPQGFDTMVGERGVGLSGGQRQSVTLARALLGRPQILLLDEPTSDMDHQTEQQFIKRLNEQLKGRTLILVTHRLSLLALTDRIIVMENGRKVEDGPKTEVLKKLKGASQRRSEAPSSSATHTTPRAQPVKVRAGALRVTRPTQGNQS